MYDELAKRLRDAAKMSDALAVLLPHSEGNATAKLYNEAADAIEELTAERDKYKRHSDSISRLPDCNTCGKKAKGNCEFMPEYGDYVRINCAFFEPEPPKEEMA